MCGAVLLAVLFTGCSDEAQVGKQVTGSVKRDLNRARFTEAALQAPNLQREIIRCLAEFENNIDDNQCNSGASGPTYRIPNEYSTTYFDSIKVKLGSIIMTANHKDTLNGETYILDPVLNGGSVTWTLAEDSTCKAAGYC